MGRGASNEGLMGDESPALEAPAHLGLQTTPGFRVTLLD